MHKPILGLATLAGTTLPNTALAHSFGISYSLPVPLWLYGSGGAVALALSFAVAAIFTRHGVTAANSPAKVVAQNGPLSGLMRICQWIAVCLLALAIATGLFGHPNAYANLNMTLFWIVFVLAFAYFSAVVGGVYAQANPWQNLSVLAAKLVKPMQNGLFVYDHKSYGYWPAIALYMAFIWVELFGGTKPLSLAYYLLAYTGINLIGSVLWGVKHWFRYGEFFSVFLRLVTLSAPFHLRQTDAGKMQLTAQWPFSGLLKETADHRSLVIFVLFMLSSTAYDGLHETVVWQRLFWTQLLPTLDPSVADQGLRAIITHQNWYHAFQWGSLIAGPFIYLGAYWLALWAGKKLANSTLPLQLLSQRFAYSLLPIALVYHVTHYYTLLQTQGIKVLALFSDPFGIGWNLFGTADWFKEPIIPNISLVWHVQVITIVLGHIISVYIAHVEALRLFDNRRTATLSQLPMLLLMMAFTTAGLWILAQPIQSGL